MKKTNLTNKQSTKNISTNNAVKNIQSGLTKRKHIYITKASKNKSFYVDFKMKGQRYYLGTFNTLNSAIRARNVQYRMLGMKTNV